MKKKTKLKLLKRKGFVNDRMVKFAKLYALTGKLTQSYINAGYTARGNSASACAIKLLSNAHIQELVSNERSRIVEKYEIETDSILGQLKVIAYSDIRDYLHFDGKHLKLKSLNHIDNILSKAIKSYRMIVSRTGRTVITLELYDKVEALIKLGEYLSMWKARESGESEIHVTMVDARKAS